MNSRKTIFDIILVNLCSFAMLSLNCSLWNSVSQMRSHATAAFRVVPGGLAILSAELYIIYVIYRKMKFTFLSL